MTGLALAVIGGGLLGYRYVKGKERSAQAQEQYNYIAAQNAETNNNLAAAHQKSKEAGVGTTDTTATQTADYTNRLKGIRSTLDNYNAESRETLG